MAIETESGTEIGRIESDKESNILETYRAYFMTGEGFVFPRIGHIAVEATDGKEAGRMFNSEYGELELIGLEVLEKGDIMTTEDISGRVN